MLLSEKYNFIYLKTHKTASTSVEMALEQFCAPPGHRTVMKNAKCLVTNFGIIGARAGGTEAMKNINHFWHHMTAKKVIDRIGEKKFFSCSCVTTIRNPFARLVSQFYFQPTWNKNFPQPPDSLHETRVMFEMWLDSYFNSKSEGTPQFKANSDKAIVFYEGKNVVTDYIRVEHMKGDLENFLIKHSMLTTSLDLHKERDNQNIKKFKPKELFFKKELIQKARIIDSWVFDLGVYPDHP